MIIKYFLSILLVFIVSAKVIAVGDEDSNSSNKEVMNKIISIIEADENNESDEVFVMSSLSSLKDMYPAEVNFRLGQIFYFGRFGVEDIKKSVEYLSIASSMNHPGSNYTRDH
jgi:TPR repeat protein